MSMRNNRNSTQKMTIAESLRLTIRQEMERDKKVFCIGDNLNTDIKGANNQDFDCLLITNGIHKKEILDTDLKEVLKK